MKRFDNIDREFDLLHKESYGCLSVLILSITLCAYFNHQQKYLWLSVALIISCISVLVIIRSKQNLKNQVKWLENNEGVKLIFYPSKREKQLEIQNLMAHQLNKDIGQIYYEGPLLAGDLDNPTLISTLKTINKNSPNHPRFFKISNQKLLEICPLFELLDIASNKEVVTELIKNINSY